MKKCTLLIRKFRLILVSLLLSALCFHSYAQDYIPVSPNPDTWSQMRYGGTSSVNHFNGEVGVSIPIYTYEDPDFKIPISLSYGSGGWMPQIEAGIVGKNWTLNLGGCVSRTVRGLPDDKILEVPEYVTQLFLYPYNIQTYNYCGYMQAHLNLTSSPSNFSLANSYPHPFPIIGNGWEQYPNGIVGEFIETTPDLFSFRFGEHYGCFMLQPNGKMNFFNLSQPDVNYTITFTGFTPSDHVYGKEIKITTGDGYSYFFGASYLSKQDFITMDGHPDQERPLTGDAEYNLTWPLTKIISPTGRVITFEYDLIVKERTIGYFGSYINREYYDYFDDNFGHQILRYQEADGFNPNTGVQISSILRKVNIDANATITLNYTNDDKWLKSITINSLIGNNTIPQTYMFAYNDTNPDKYRCLLKRVICPSGIQYKFDYYDETTIKNGDIISDKWGFHNNNPELGVIKQITYPTGGYTVFNYEQHILSSYIDRDVLVNSPCTTSGTRISKITDYSSPSDFVWRSYTYSNGTLKGYPNNSEPAKTAPLKFVHQHSIDDMCHLDYLDYMEYIKTSIDILNKEEPWVSGIIYQNGYWEWKKNRGNWGGFYGKLIDHESYTIKEYNSQYSTNYTTERHVEYPLVTEHFSDGSKIEYRFTSFADLPDYISDNSYETSPIYRSHYVMNLNKLWQDGMFYWCKYYAIPTDNNYNHEKQWHDVIDRSALRGKLTSMKVYAANSSTPSLHKEIEYDIRIIYNEGGYKKGLYNYIPSYVPGFIQYPKKTITTEYLDSGTITSEILTEYDNKLRKVSTKQSNGKTSIVEYYYPKDLSSVQIHQKMMSWNMDNIPIRIVSSIKENDSAIPYITGAIENIYTETNNRICLQETKQTNINAPIPSTSFNINSYLINGVKFRYCNRGRIIEVTDQNNVKTTVIWGYNKTYVIAELKNCSFEEAQAAFTYSNLDTFSSKNSYSANDWNALNVLRTSSSLKNVLITTYEHIPFAGIVKMTDPSGRSASYNYDEFYRLTEILNDSGSKLEAYQYNIGQ